MVFLVLFRTQEQFRLHDLFIRRAQLDYYAAVEVSKNKRDANDVKKRLGLLTTDEEKYFDSITNKNIKNANIIEAIRRAYVDSNELQSFMNMPSTRKDDLYRYIARKKGLAVKMLLCHFTDIKLRNMVRECRLVDSYCLLLTTISLPI